MSRNDIRVAVLGLCVLAGSVPSATAAVITVGQSGADHDNIDDAMAAAGASDTVQFIDSATYVTTNALRVDVSNLTIESVTNHRATIYFTNTTGALPSQYWAILNSESDTTLNNLHLYSDRKVTIPADNSPGLLVTNVHFTLTYTNTYNGADAIQSYHEMTVVDSTFYGAALLGLGTGHGGRGISISDGTTNIVIRHCSFDRLQMPITNPSANNPTIATITDCAFGHYHGSSWAQAINIATEGGAQVYEDYNGTYRDDAFSDADVTSGGHSVDVAVYADVFQGNTTAGDWRVGPALYYTASNGMTIGVWQHDGVLTVGPGGEYADFASALAVAAPTDTIRFLDSGTYTHATVSTLSGVSGLTIESAEGEKATIEFTGAGWSGIVPDSEGITVQDVRLVSTGRTTVVSYGGAGTNCTFRRVDFVQDFGGSVMDARDGWLLEYCTFYGKAAGSTGGAGIACQKAGELVTINHCSFDNLGYAPVFNSVGGAFLSVSNCLFGAWHTVSYYRTAIKLGASTLTEDYNASWGNGQDLAYGDGGSSITSGGHSFKVSTYADAFTGDTGAGDWKVPYPLYNAASDGTTIGAWQFVPKGSVMIVK